MVVTIVTCSWGKINHVDDISISTHKCTLITELPKMLIIILFGSPFSILTYKLYEYIHEKLRAT